MILVTGGNGQVGRCFQEAARTDFVFTDFSDLDITDKKAVDVFFEKNTLRWCINCAAYTAVDRAESEPLQARRINTLGARNLAEACARHKVQMIHLSTDYVYHNRQNTPFKEGDPERPQSVYARTKLAGDRAVLNAGGGMVIRTSWVYAPWGHNFVRTMMRLGRERAQLNVVFDQIGTPTYAPDLAGAILHIIEKVERGAVGREQLAGVWHYSNEGVTSWYDFAVAVFDILRIPCKVAPIETRAYPTPAARPPFSVLNKEKIKSGFQMDIPHWRESLQLCLQQMENQGDIKP